MLSGIISLKSLYNSLTTPFSPSSLFISVSIPSPSSLIDLGSETAKHCMVSYFCCSCSCGSSWFLLWGLTSILQLNVWLFLLGPSLDHGTPFTAGDQETKRDLQCGLLEICFSTRMCHSQKQTTQIWIWWTATSEEREATTLQRKDIMRTRQSKWRQKKWESSSWVEISHNEHWELWDLCHLSTAMHHSQASICTSSKTSLPIFLPTLTYNKQTRMYKSAHTYTQKERDAPSLTHQHTTLANSHHTPSGLWSHSVHW